jgi:hypothetical protein
MYLGLPLFCLANSRFYVLAQNFAGEPACATPCLASAIVAAGCDLTDEACACGPAKAAIGNLVGGCIYNACPQTEVALAISVGLQLCDGYSSSHNLKSLTSTTSLFPGLASVTPTPSLTISTSSSTTTTIGASLLTVTVVTSAIVSYSTASTSNSATGASSTTTSHNNTLTSSAIAGIAIGAIATIIIGIGLLAWIVLLRRRRVKTNTIWPNTKTGQAELDGSRKPHELHGEHLVRETSAPIDSTESGVWQVEELPRGK